MGLFSSVFAESTLSKPSDVMTAEVEPLVESPLLAEETAHGTLILSAFDPQHLVYPVKILMIDEWRVTEAILSTDYRLAPGEHKLVLAPDFSNIRSKQVFMDEIWLEKTISFTLHEEQEIALTARLIDRESLEWEIQLYQIKTTFLNSEL